MGFLHRQVNLDRAIVRPVVAGDAGAVSLVHIADRRLLTSGVEEAGMRLVRDPAMLLELDGRALATVAAGWLTTPVAWLRTIAIDGRVAIDGALGRLFPPLYAALRHADTHIVAVTVDEWSLAWLRGPLERLGYRRMVDVIGYQKLRMHVPSYGNQAAIVRRAAPADLAAVLRLDVTCFPPPWTKGSEIFDPALQTSPCFWVAEWDGVIVGYAFATVHQGGRLVHLVRIAVDPACQGRGIGVRLLSEVVGWCAGRGTTLLSLNTQADNHHAQRLYEWFGFTRTDERQHVFGCTLV